MKQHAEDMAAVIDHFGWSNPDVIGHSMGENAAACIAGVMTLEGVIGLVHLRGKLFDTVPAGGMLSVPLSEAALAPYLGDLDIASINAPELTVVSGSDDGLKALAERLKADDIDTTRIAIDIAAHSRMLEPILAVRMRPADVETMEADVLVPMCCRQIACHGHQRPFACGIRKQLWCPYIRIE
jgi:acyl transferase domain-containing protein